MLDQGTNICDSINSVILIEHPWCARLKATVLGTQGGTRGRADPRTTVIHWGGSRWHSDPILRARTDLAEDLGSIKKRRNRTWRTGWGSGAKWTNISRASSMCHALWKCSLPYNWIFVACQLYGWDYYVHFTEQQTEAWQAALPKVIPVGDKARFTMRRT